MNRLASDRFWILLAMLIPFVGGVLSAEHVAAEPAGESNAIYVSVNLDGRILSEVQRSDEAGEPAPQTTIGGLNARPVLRNAALPDSLHFAGLAGTLSLAIDTSGSTPYVDGIELAPRETLRFVAGGSQEIRGLQGQISIRLDF